MSEPKDGTNRKNGKVVKTRVQEYFELEARQLIERYRHFQTLLPASDRDGSQHTGEEGRYLEGLIRTLLNKYLPGDLRALSGFILRPAAEVGDSDKHRTTEKQPDRTSSQLDIIIYDVNRYPVYERYEEFVIVPPEGVVGVISVKKKLRKNDVKNELIALSRAASLCSHYVRGINPPMIPHDIRNEKYGKHSYVVGPVTALIGYTHDLENKTAQEIMNHLSDPISELQQDIPADCVIDILSVLDTFTMLKGKVRDPRKNTKKKDDTKPIEFRLSFNGFLHKDDVGVNDNRTNNEGYSQTKDSEFMHIGIQYLIQRILENYYDPTRSLHIVKPGFVDVYNEDYDKKEHVAHWYTDVKEIDRDYVYDYKEGKSDDGVV